MNVSRSESDTLSALTSARLVARLAEEKGVVHGNPLYREPLYHVGAILADASLQAGLNYKTVVKVRVDRIIAQFPGAATLTGTFQAIAAEGITNFLSWHHHAKVERFVGLAELLRDEEIDDFNQLRSWLQNATCRVKLRAIHGIGPKTVDYLCGLVGLDYVAVDRHIKTFANDAGVLTADYDVLQTVMSYAADLLGVSRRHFDASIWNYVATQKTSALQTRGQLSFDGVAAVA
jgi:hypothetical protein